MNELSGGGATHHSIKLWWQGGHPPLLKEYLAGNLSIEEAVIYEKLFGYCKDYDKKLDDPVWHQIGMKIKKYLPFLNIDKEKYRKQVIAEVNDQF